MIVVTGEALIDLVVDRGGRVAAQLGGAAFNTARTIARLGLAPTYLGRLSADTFGRLLRDRLGQDGVTLGVPEECDAPTSLAAVDLGPGGVARYHFYLTGTSLLALDYPQLSAALPGGVTALHAGGLALAAEPIATGIERLITSDVPAGALVMIDPNCRPQAITDRAAYLARLSRILARADVVKVSVEDLEYLAPGRPARAAAATLLGQEPALVLVTDGPRMAHALGAGLEVSVEVPAVEVVDTIGAGDAFGGAFLAWWSGSGLTRSDLHQASPVSQALRAAVEVAALTCTRAGAEPPWFAELSGQAGQRSWGAGPGPA